MRIRLPLAEVSLKSILGWRKEGDSKTLMHRIVQHEKVDLDRK